MLSVRALPLLSFAALAFTSVASAQEVADVRTLRELEASLLVRDAASRARAQAWALAVGMPVRTELPNGTIREIVGWNADGPMFRTTLNVDTAQTIRTTRVWPGGGAGLSLTGTGILMGIWDGGRVDNAHTEFSGRVAIGNPVAVSNHGTHVAGTMIARGANAAAKGMAYAGNLRSYDWNSDIAEMASAAIAPHNIRVSNHSYGYVAGWTFGWVNGSRWTWMGRFADTRDWKFGFYDSTSKDVDTMLFSAPFYLPVVSAGNDRNDNGPAAGAVYDIRNAANTAWTTSTAARVPDGNYDSIPMGLQTAKNTLTVAAVRPIPGGYAGPASVLMSTFSSWGPADDGRIKPDISACGVSVFSTEPGGAYGTKDGTSMAAPSVAGSLGLLVQRQRQVRGTDMRAATLKALAIHTADEAGAAPGPDYAFGWGLMNTERAARHIGMQNFHPYAIREFVKANAQTIQIPVVSDGVTPFKVTIAWTDRAGTPTSVAVNPRNRMLVNDLDLRVVRGATTYLPWRLSWSAPAAPAVRGDNVYDNVEQVVLPVLPVGTNLIRVTNKGALVGGAQAFSMIVSGINPPVAVSGPASFRGGRPTNLIVRVYDPAPAGGVRIALSSTSPAIPVPASVVIPAGATAVLVPILPRVVTANTTVRVTANGSGVSRTGSFVVTP